MTRNEFIANTAARYSVGRPNDSDEACIGEAERLADSLESRGFAPWQSAPALADAARRVVEAAVAWNAAYESADDFRARETRVALSDAVRAYKESAK